MAGVMETVNQRTQLVGQNRLELLLFHVSGRQQYGINVFKVREVIHSPQLTVLPMCHDVVRGIAHIRDATIPIIDLAMAIGISDKPLPLENAFTIIAEYNVSVQGFLVSSVLRIVNMNWSSINPPPEAAGNNYLTAVTQVDNEIVEIIDVEQVLSEVMPLHADISAEIVATAKEEAKEETAVVHRILVADDSAVARSQIKRCMEKIGIEVVTVRDGLEALTLLQKLADSGKDIHQEFSLIISDIEMPEMDGYTLTTEIRNDARFGDIYIILHTSMSGVFNEVMVEKVGANDFIAKFQPDILASSVREKIHSLHENKRMKQ